MPVARPDIDKPPVKGGSALHPTPDKVYVPAEPFSANYRATILETKFEDQPAIISHIEGSPWTLEFWLSQVLSGDSPLQGQQLTSHAIHQQYHAIIGMEIRVQGSLSHSQDAASSESTVTGSAHVFPFLIANVGDMFVARLFDGSIGIFQVTRSEKLSIMKESAYAIDYILVGRNDKARYDDLMRKIVKRSYFNRDFLYHGQNPILTEEAFDTLKFLQRTYHQINQSFFDSFFSVEYATLLVPGQMQPTYDKFLLNAVLGMVDQRSHDRIKYIRNLNVQDDNLMRSRSIWDVLRSRDRNQMYDIFTKVGVVPAESFTKQPIFEGIRYSGIRKVIYPLDPPFHVDSASSTIVKMPFTGMVDGGEKNNAFKSYKERKQKFEDSQLEPGQDPVVVTDEDVYRELGIKPVFSDDYYVFSKAFYDNDTAPFAQSKMEVLVNRYIDGESISYAELRDLAKNVHCWSVVEKYFYTPVLMVLIGSIIRNL